MLKQSSLKPKRSTPPAMTTLDGFVAFTEQGAHKVVPQGRLSAEHFNVNCPWVPFADTVEGAIAKAMMSSQSNPDAATTPTTWFVLHIVLTAEQFLESFRNQLLHKCNARGVPGWRFYGKIELGVGNSFEWLQITVGPYVGPIGIAARDQQAWKEKNTNRLDYE